MITKSEALMLIDGLWKEANATNSAYHEGKADGFDIAGQIIEQIGEL